MKQIKSLPGLLLVGLFFVFSAAAQEVNFPAVRDGEAVEQLKKSEDFVALRNSLKAANQPDNLFGNPSKFDTVGQLLTFEWRHESSMTSSDGTAEDLFGYSVAISGNTAIVGSVGNDVGVNIDQGSAYIFVYSGNHWIQQAKLIAADGAAFDNFGRSVAIDGDTAIVGTTSDVGLNDNQGKAYIFVRSGRSWIQQAILTADDGTAQDFFGTSVAISGDKVIVGATFDDVGANLDQGSAYIFVRSENRWSQQARLTADNGAAFDNLGNCVAISGDTVIVGAYFADVGGNANQGSAYIFARSDERWIQEAQFTANTALFGNSVAIDGDTAVVGVFGDDIGANPNQGSAYVYARSGGGWTQQSHLTAADGEANANFGRSVGISGDTIVVGANSDDVGANANQGSAYIFNRADSIWTERKKLIDDNGAPIDNFGISASVSGNKVVIGSFSTDIASPSTFDETGNTGNVGVNQGAAIFFANAPQPAPTISISGRITDSRRRAISAATVTATDSQGAIYTTLVKTNGTFNFENMLAGENYTINVYARRYRFLPQIVNSNTNLTNVNFVGN
jgi:FG-GAP repeat/Carboxypeptidase regulatory-like domain